MPFASAAFAQVSSRSLTSSLFFALRVLLAVAAARATEALLVVALLSPAWNRHDALVASSRARLITTLVTNNEIINHGLRAEAPIDCQGDGRVFSKEERRRWLAGRISRASPKISTLDVIDGSRDAYSRLAPEQAQSRELGYEL
jgi:hypothetical protein